MCDRSPEAQPYPGLHQKKHGQQNKGGDSAPLLHSGETPPRELHPALEPSAQERQGSVRVIQRRATKMIGGSFVGGCRSLEWEQVQKSLFINLTSG